MKIKSSFARYGHLVHRITFSDEKMMSVMKQYSGSSSVKGWGEAGIELWYVYKLILFSD